MGDRIPRFCFVPSAIAGANIGLAMGLVELDTTQGYGWMERMLAGTFTHRLGLVRTVRGGESGLPVANTFARRGKSMQLIGTRPARYLDPRSCPDGARGCARSIASSASAPRSILMPIRGPGTATAAGKFTYRPIACPRAFAAPCCRMSSQGSTGNVIAALASFFIPGLGQLLQGRLIKALIMFVLAAVLWWFFLGWIIHLWSIIDAALFKRSA